MKRTRLQKVLETKGSVESSFTVAHIVDMSDVEEETPLLHIILMDMRTTFGFYSRKMPFTNDVSLFH